MNENSRGNRAIPDRPENMLFDKMDVDHEWEMAQRREQGKELAEAFELDIRDCSVNEINH